MNDTDSEDTRVKSNHPQSGRMTVVGPGPLQPKPGPDAIGKTTIELSADLSQARKQAGEALRQQKVGPAQRDLVSDFYKNLTPDKGEKPK